MAEISNVVSIGNDSLIIQDRSQTLCLITKDSLIKTIGQKGESASEYKNVGSITRYQDTVFVLDSRKGKILGYSLSTNQCVLTEQDSFLRSMGSLIRQNGNFASVRPIIDLTDKLREGGKMPLKASSDDFLFSFTFDSQGKVQRKSLLKKTEPVLLTLANYLPVGNSFAHSYPHKKFNIYSDLLYPQLWIETKENSEFKTVKIILEAPSDDKIKSVADPNFSLTNKLEQELIHKCEYIEYVNILNDTIVVASKFVANNKLITVRLYDFSGQVLAATTLNLPKDALNFRCILIENGQITLLTTDTPKSSPSQYPYSFRRMVYSIQSEKQRE
jgi:hypothetical protein